MLKLLFLVQRWRIGLSLGEWRRKVEATPWDARIGCWRGRGVLRFHPVVGVGSSWRIVAKWTALRIGSVARIVAGGVVVVVVVGGRRVGLMMVEDRRRVVVGRNKLVLADWRRVVGGSCSLVGGTW